MTKEQAIELAEKFILANDVPAGQFGGAKLITAKELNEIYRREVCIRDFWTLAYERKSPEESRVISNGIEIKVDDVSGEASWRRMFMYVDLYVRFGELIVSTTRSNKEKKGNTLPVFLTLADDEKQKLEDGIMLSVDEIELLAARLGIKAEEVSAILGAFLYWRSKSKDYNDRQSESRSEVETHLLTDAPGIGP